MERSTVEPTSRAQGLAGVVAGIAKYHLRPLVLIELAAFVAALLVGWKEVALAILVLHVLRMGITALAGPSGAKHRLGHRLSHQGR